MKKVCIFSRFLAIVAMLFSLATGISKAQNTSVSNYNISRDGVLINGYDVVSYFFDDAKKGKATFTTSHEGVEYWFVNKENRDLFAKNPEKFIPAFGGWCAYAMADTGEKVKIDPETYKIVDGKLYLFYNFYFNNTLIDWNEDQANLKKKAEKNWQLLLER